MTDLLTYLQISKDNWELWAAIVTVILGIAAILDFFWRKITSFFTNLSIRPQNTSVTMADNIFVKKGIDEISNVAQTGDPRAIKTMREINEARGKANGDYKVFNAILSYYEKDQAPSQPQAKSSPKPKKPKDFAQILIEAETGDALSQFILGNMYGEGIGVTANPKQAELWYGKSAKQGNSDAMINLGVIKLDRAEFEEAEKLFARSLETIRNKFGTSHPHIAAVLNNLANLYSNKGDYDRALPLYEKSLAMSKKNLPENHPLIATVLNNLANLYSDKGDYDRALPLFEQALTMRQKTLPENHPDIATSLNNLANLYFFRGNYDRALPLFEQALTMRQKNPARKSSRYCHQSE